MDFQQPIVLCQPGQQEYQPMMFSTISCLNTSQAVLAYWIGI